MSVCVYTYLRNATAYIYLYRYSLLPAGRALPVVVRQDSDGVWHCFRSPASLEKRQYSCIGPDAVARCKAWPVPHAGGGAVTVFPRGTVAPHMPPTRCRVCVHRRKRASRLLPHRVALLPCPVVVQVQSKALALRSCDQPSP